ncbi:uncharacterized protein K452DRAFT_296692 [Aplosporella prunicola CBS 121167]|uniref:Uncharacterized protein n=1 Tax=Aplosporella prunicola CBS 121167 TaxID=1176127 RepID=A0A6A6BHS7_9PEZI|nr:uncharacterized protein K452DRAFT_296692 [Aplosporella prunicola CBS 121167]KAF2143699.1 hypothetical protein K452DRAFT_296692 [Aplosporella prunicola CBS 121167]
MFAAGRNYALPETAIRRSKAAAVVRPPIPAHCLLYLPCNSPSMTVVISRNKYEHLTLLAVFRHWRYISSFGGPWLHLPPDLVESLAHTYPVDPALPAEGALLRTRALTKLFKHDCSVSSTSRSRVATFMLR